MSIFKNLYPITKCSRIELLVGKFHLVTCQHRFHEFHLHLVSLITAIAIAIAKPTLVRTLIFKYFHPCGKSTRRLKQKRRIIFKNSQNIFSCAKLQEHFLSNKNIIFSSFYQVFGTCKYLSFTLEIDEISELFSCRHLYNLLIEIGSILQDTIQLCIFIKQKIFLYLSD